MPKTLMVLGKVSMACPSSKESAEGGSREGQFMGSFIQVNGEVPILLWCTLNVGVRSRNGIYDGQSGTAWLEPEAIYVQEAPPAREDA